MSKFRKKLLLSINTEASWYRLCPGGIYTTNSAYIDTLFKNFNNNALEIYVDSKVLVDNYSKARRLCGASVPSYHYTIISYWLKSNEAYSNIYMGARVANSTSWTSPMKSLQPFLDKKVRFTQVPNISGNNSYIQIYNNGILGNKVYFGYSVEDGSFANICSYSLLIFDRSSKGVPQKETATDIALYELGIKYKSNIVHIFKACQLTSNIPANLASDNKAHSAGEFGMYDEITGLFFGNANSTGYFLEHFD